MFRALHRCRHAVHRCRWQKRENLVKTPRLSTAPPTSPRPQPPPGLTGLLLQFPEVLQVLEREPREANPYPWRIISALRKVPSSKYTYARVRPYLSYRSQSYSSRTRFPSAIRRVNAVASSPKYWTGFRGSFVSGVSTPISRTRSPPSSSSVSPSMTRLTI